MVNSTITLFEDSNYFKQEDLEKVIGHDWTHLLYHLFNSPEIVELNKRIKERRQVATVYPDKLLLFKPFTIKPSEVSVILVNPSSPYPTNINDGLGLSSFVPTRGTKNFFESIGRTNPNMYDLLQQGFFSINYIWTCEHKNQDAHINYGWEIFTRELIRQISLIPKFKIFVWLGSNNNLKKLKRVVVKNKTNYHLYRESI